MSNYTLDEAFETFESLKLRKHNKTNLIYLFFVFFYFMKRVLMKLRLSLSLSSHGKRPDAMIYKNKQTAYSELSKYLLSLRSKMKLSENYGYIEHILNNLKKTNQYLILLWDTKNAGFVENIDANEIKSYTNNAISFVYKCEIYITELKIYKYKEYDWKEFIKAISLLKRVYSYEYHIGMLTLKNIK